MTDYDPILNVLREDIRAFWTLLVVAGATLILPALIAAFLAASVTRPTLVRDLPAGALCAWLAGTLSCALFFAIFSGLVTILSPPFGDPLWPWPASAVLALSLGLVFGYRAAARYYRWRIEDRLGWKIDDPLPVAKNRWYSFSLRKLFVVQLALVTVFGLWIGARRETILRDYRWRAERREEEAFRDSVRERFGSHGWNIGNDRRPLRLWSFGQPLTNFSDEVLAKIQPADELIHLEVNSHELTDAGLGIIARQQDLTLLRIESNQVTDAGITHLSRLPKLEQLGLACEHITEQSLKELQNLKSLKTLELTRVRISREHLDRFQEAHGQVQVFVLSR